MTIFIIYDNIIVMDEITKSKIRNYGAIAVVLIIILFAILFMMQYKEKAIMAAKLNIINTELNQSIAMSITENDLPAQWGFRGGYKNIPLLQQNFFHYFQVDKYCLHTPDDCMPDVKYKSIKEKETEVNLRKFPSVKLKNGVSLAIEAVSSCQKKNEQCALIYVDINNIEEPNAFGKDLFVFSLINSQRNSVTPYGFGLPIKDIQNDENYGCNKKANMALYCAALLKANGWKANSKYPW